MAGVGVMIEAQEGLTWDLWRTLCADVEQLGLDSLWRSEHLFSVMGVEGRECLDCWTSLALAAEWTSRVEFGPLVSPLTFHRPAVLARAAASIDQLSGGRFVFGVGAGWYDEEHRRMGIELPPLKQRFDRFEAGLHRIKEVLALGHPDPVRRPLPLQIGGSGEKRLLRLVAEHATEWNSHGLPLDDFRHKQEVLARHCEDVGRDPREIRHSMMWAFVTDRDHARRIQAVIPRLRDLEPEAMLEAVSGRWLVGDAEQIAEQLRPYIEAGASRFMLQHFAMDDRDALEVLAQVQRLVA
jgi:alkanesulfonate monooxygenase SsuD/methylene tetrahydromethanopterin reductase-like flavin-dependent oxidoreductase (luciferase family)